MPIVKQLEHSADYRVKIVADDRADLFKGALNAIVMYCVNDIDSVHSLNVTISHKITIKADNIEELLVRFLNDILYLMDEKNALFFDVTVNSISDTSVTATLYGVSRSTVDFEGEIKSATYHNLTVEQTIKKFTATVLFDV